MVQSKKPPPFTPKASDNGYLAPSSEIVATFVFFSFLEAVSTTNIQGGIRREQPIVDQVSHLNNTTQCSGDRC